MSRNITNTPTKIFVNTVSAREPLELLTPSDTSSTMTLKGLNGFGTANQFIKVNSTGDGLVYVDNITGTAPIIITGSAISYDISGLGDATLALTDNVFVQQGTNLKKTTFTNIKTLLGVSDLTTATNFATSATGVIKLGNSQGSAQTASLEFYGTSFKLKNTSNVNVATFTPVSNTCNLDLNAGLLTKFTASGATAVWNGATIGTIYGGTGLTTYTKGQILYASGTNTLAKLNIGSADQFLIVGSTGIPTWSNIPVSIYTTITEVPNTNLFLMVDSSNAYKKVSVNNFVQLYQDTINYGGLAPIVKDTSNDLYKFDLFNLTNITSIGNSATFFISSTGFNEQYRKITFANLQSSLITNGILTDGVNFGTDTTNTANRVFGNSTRNSVINSAVLSLQSAGTTRVSISGDIITMARGSTDLRVAHSTDTNAFTASSTTCHISSVNDLHLFSPSQQFAGSLNRYVCLAGSSQSETAMFGYAGSSIAISNGGIPDGNTTTPIGSAFAMSTGSAGVFSIVNRLTTAFSTTATQFQIKLNDTDFYTERVTINGNVGEANLKLNSSGGAIIGQSGRSYVGRDTNTGYIYLGNAVDSSELFSTITYAKTIDLSVGLDSTGDFSIKSAGERRIKITGSGSRHTLIGRRADSTATAETALHVCNNSLSSSSTDARIRIESRTSTYDPVLEFCANTGNDSTQVISFVYGNNSGNVIVTSNGPTTKYFIVFTRVITNSYNYFVNQNSISGFQVWTSASSIFSTGSFFWRQWVNGEGVSNNGNLLFQYSTQNGSYGPRAFISSGTSSYVQMNFTGQHRCVPEEEELYDNVDNYIGMVVESTGLYNSMDFEEYEEVIDGESVVDEYTDPETGIKYPETRTPTSHIVKKTRLVYTTEPTINDCEPIVKLTTTYKSKKVFGVISNKEDIDSNGGRSFLVGNFGSTFEEEKKDNRLYINSVGEGGILVNNQNGNIENGDLLCSSNTPGIACKQDDDIVRNYTIGKATMDYNFTGNENKLIGCVYYCG